MTDDPMVEEVRAIRDEHAARFGYDLAAIFADLKRSEAMRDQQKFPLRSQQRGGCSEGGIDVGLETPDHSV